MINVLHRDPRYFKDPEKFEPNRFLDSEFESGPRHPFAYLPFSASHRNCIGKSLRAVSRVSKALKIIGTIPVYRTIACLSGQKFAMMELRTVVTEIVRNFELIPITRVEDVKIISDLVLRAKDPIFIQFVSRQKFEESSAGVK